MNLQTGKYLRVVGSILLTVCCFSTSIAYSEKSKQIEKHITVTPSQKIDISDFPSSKITVKAWDKSEVYLSVKVKISASDEDYETQFIDSIKIQENTTPSGITVSLKDNAPEDNDNQFNFFGLKFGSYFKKDISVEIYVPAANILTATMKYSKLSIEGIRGELRVLGKNNSLMIADCSQLKDITNDYGSTAISGCKSTHFILSIRSGSVQINDFDGAVELSAPYSSIKLNTLRLGAVIKAKNSTIELTNAGGDITVDAAYSTITLAEVKGQVFITSRSAVISLKKTGSATVNSEYSTIDFREIRGEMIVITVATRSGVVRIDEATAKVEIDAPQSKIALRKVTGEIGITTQNGKISATEVSGKLNIKAENSTVISRSTDVNSVWINGKSNSIEISCIHFPKNSVVLNEQGTTSMTIPTGFMGLLNLESQQARIETNLQLPENAKGATVFRGELGNSNETITIKSGLIRLFQL
jgi:hypothetical protein